MVASVTRTQVLGFRVRAQQLDRDTVELANAAILDMGVQDTGPDGARWALANRGVDIAERSDDELVKVWTIRGAPHVYLRKNLPSIAAAVEPFSDADAGKRIYDAAKPLKTAGISNLAALDAVAAAMRHVVTKPMAKGGATAAASDVGPGHPNLVGAYVKVVLEALPRPRPVLNFRCLPCSHGSKPWRSAPIRAQPQA